MEREEGKSEMSRALSVNIPEIITMEVEDDHRTVRVMHTE